MNTSDIHARHVFKQYDILKAKHYQKYFNVLHEQKYEYHTLTLRKILG